MTNKQRSTFIFNLFGVVLLAASLYVAYQAVFFYYSTFGEML